MKNIKDRFSNKKGFTLVELIVVIVIILILAAALVPNVMRYIDEARKASFKSDASSYLVEVQGASAEFFAKYDVDVTTNAFGAGQELTSGGTKVNAEKPSGNASVKVQAITIKEKNGSATKTIEIQVSDGAVTQFAYADKEHFIQWTQAHGWFEVDDDGLKLTPTGP